jgi:hypothetical protein
MARPAAVSSERAGFIQLAEADAWPSTGLS